MQLPGLGVAALLTAALMAQTQTPPVISADTFDRLRPVAQIDFADLTDVNIDSGGFSLSSDGARIALRSRAQAVVVFDDSGTQIDTFSVRGADGIPDTILDMAFSHDPAGRYLAVLATDGAVYQTVVRDFETGDLLSLTFPRAGNTPLRVWFDADGTAIWYEVQPNDTTMDAFVMRSPLPGERGLRSGVLMPAVDREAIVRIGRIPLPYAVTASDNGRVKLWDIERGRLLRLADLGSMPVFGGVNSPPTHLAWRDPGVDELRLLDWTTGDDRLVTSLNGTYLAFVLLTPAADLIVGVEVGGDDVIAAWNTTTGERIDLGAYRACTRTPDMAQLSADGTTLVIGCDTGVELWRVAPA